MIVRETTASELKIIAQIEQQAHASAFISKMSLDEHQTNFEKNEIVYLSIIDSTDDLAGYFILASESEETSIEFRRIVVASNRRGIGQTAIKKMEQYCISKMGKTRIWLNVYSDNEIGIHVYSKLSYQFDREAEYQGRRLRFYSKELGK